MDQIKKPEVYIRADGNAKIGLGHIHRTLALADCLKDHFQITFCVYGADELVSGIIKNKGYALKNIISADYNDPGIFTGVISKEAVIVIDGYDFKTDYQKALKESGHKVIAIDDLNEWENVANAVINHGYSGKEYKIAEGSKLYSGLKYAIIKPEILKSQRSVEKKENKKILVSIGGTDPEGHSEKIVNALLKETDKEISLLTYPLNPAFDKLQKLALDNSKRLKLFHSLDTKCLIELINENDMAILQPSNIALEAMALGIHISLIQTAENQKFILKTLVDSGCAVELNLENINSVSVDQINEQLKRQSEILDERSPARLLDIANSLVLEFRKVKPEDVKLIYDWNNDPVTRSNSHNTAKIEYADHEKWFASKIVDQDLDFLLFSYNKIPCGSVRIERKQNENVIGIAIAPEFRGKKLAPLILSKAGEYFYENHGNKEITAYIKKQNLPSIKSFEKAGYKIMNEGEYCGDAGYRLIKKAE